MIDNSRPRQQEASTAKVRRQRTSPDFAVPTDCPARKSSIGVLLPPLDYNKARRPAPKSFLLHSMKFFVGTSGYSYKEWKGHFYPEKLPDKKMLEFYAQHFSAVEINSTFRRFPMEDTVESWVQQAPRSFRFVLKARQTITHFRRLQNADEQIDDFINLASILKQHQGPLLFQLPPNFTKDLPRLEAFLTYVDGRAAVVFQFQHESWFEDDVYSCLRAHSAALCSVDDEGPACDKVIGATNWGYVRLREERYTDARLKKWIEKLKAEDWNECFVFFKHEDAGAGPTLAARFVELAGR
jgi:uncharacterized protein YecE (DUF72 family)